MLTLAYYILKVIICSGILYGYYLIVLRDKIFHKWNRFYLLAVIIISLTAPLIKINIWQKADEPKTQVVQLLQVVNTGDEFVYEYTKDKGAFQINASNLSLFIYIVVSGFLFVFLVQTLLKINRLKKSCQQTIIEGVNFINTNAKGTPFSFFNNIFWNDKIDLNTPTGKQIFKHEVAHVQEKHSYDKIFINVLLIFFWINPFFWLIRKELNMIHEFIADKKALEDSDTAAFAVMILQATYPQQQFNITNNFFYSPLKRRLIMLTKNKNSKINYASRMLVLPLAAMVFFAFTLKMKTINSTYNYSGKKITVVIDAGHGGSDKGIFANNIYEKDLALSIAKEIKELNKNDKINIILSREEDKNISVKERVLFSEANKADLFVSIHVDGEVNKNAHSGLVVMIPEGDNAYLKESKLLGTYILESFRTNYQLQIPNNLIQPNKGVWILNANQCPAVLIETGFLTSQKDLEYLSKTKNQKIIAQNILNGIEKYVQQKSNHDIIQDTAAVHFNSKEDAIRNFLQQRISGIKENNAEKDFLVGKLSEFNKTFIKLNIKNDTIPKKYGKDSAIKDNKVNVATYDSKGNPIGYKNINPKMTDDEIRQVPIIFTKVEVPPAFPGGEQAWTRYMTKIMTENIDELTKENKSGTCRVKFIVNVDGTVSDVHVTTMEGTALAKAAVNAIKKGPNWVPAMQNGQIVTAYRDQPITFTIQEN